MWKKEPKLYRGRYYAISGSGATIRRKSLKTERLDVAKRRLVDLRRFDKEQPILIKDIYAEYQQERENKYNSLDYIWRSLSPHFGHLRPDQINKDVCKEYIEMRKVSNGTIRRELGALRAAMNLFNPNNTATYFFPKPPPPKDRYLTRQEVSQLLDACLEPHIRLYIILSVCTAARKSALLELTWDRVDFERGHINLGSGDANKRRAVVPMNKTAEHELEEAYRVRLTDNVIEYNGKPIKDIKKGFARTAKRAGIEGITPHVLRHTSAVWMAENRVPMSEIAQYLGHSSTAVTEKVYARYSPDYLRTAADSLELSSFELGSAIDEKA